MTWRGPALSEDQNDLAAVLDAVAAKHDGALEDGQVAPLVTELAELGVWTLGTEESAGGGGADHATTAMALERLGRYWPALGWASAQAHAAVDVLGPDPRFADLVAGLHQGRAAVAVVDTRSPQVRLRWNEGRLVGSVDRVDVADPAPYVLLLDGTADAVLVPPQAIVAEPFRRTGLGGAASRSLEIDAGSDAVAELHGIDVGRARRLLAVAGAAVAAGIAGAAVDSAIEYAEGRRQFGDALTALPTVRQSLMRQAAGASVALRAVREPALDETQAWSVLQQACESAIEVATAALQSHGGYGYLAEYPAERRLRDAVSLRAATSALFAETDAAEALVGRGTAQHVRIPRSEIA